MCNGSAFVAGAELTVGYHTSIYVHSQHKKKEIHLFVSNTIQYNTWLV